MVGGRPIRSSVTRRMSVSLEAGGEGFSPSLSKRARTKASIGLSAQPFNLVTGSFGATGFTYAQCFGGEALSPETAPMPMARRAGRISRSFLVVGIIAIPLYRNGRADYHLWFKARRTRAP